MLQLLNNPLLIEYVHNITATSKESLKVVVMFKYVLRIIMIHFPVSFNSFIEMPLRYIDQKDTAIKYKDIKCKSNKCYSPLFYILSQVT